jgi:hypothetical protein
LAFTPAFGFDVHPKETYKSDVEIGRVANAWYHLAFVTGPGE